MGLVVPLRDRELRQCSIVRFTRLSIWGNHIFSLIRLFVLSMPRCVRWAKSIVLYCRTAGITIPVPLRTMPCQVVVNSSFTGLKGLTAGESHLFVRFASFTCVNTASELVASIILAKVMALLDTLCCATKLMYCPVIFSCFRQLSAVGCRYR